MTCVLFILPWKQPAHDGRRDPPPPENGRPQRGPELVPQRAPDGSGALGNLSSDRTGGRLAPEILPQCGSGFWGLRASLGRLCGRVRRRLKRRGPRRWLGGPSLGTRGPSRCVFAILLLGLYAFGPLRIFAPVLSRARSARRQWKIGREL